MNKKGQMVIYGLIFGFLLVVIFAVLLTPLNAFIAIGVNASKGTANEGIMTVMLNNIPVLMVIVILMAIVGMIAYRQGA